jgi:hypothetical protein
MADLVTVSEGEAPARIAALIEMFESDAPAAELLVASRALEEQMAHLHDGKDWTDDTCPLLHQLLALIAATPATKLAFTASVARCMLLQLGHLWHFCHERHEPFVAWVVQHLLRKNALPEVRAACALLSELLARCEHNQEADTEGRTASTAVAEAATDRLEELADSERSKLQASAGADAQVLAEELLEVLEGDGEPEPLDTVMARVAAFFTAAHDLDTARKLPVAVREDLLDINCEFFPFVEPGAAEIAAREQALAEAGGAAAPVEEAEVAPHVHAAVEVALAASADGGPSLFACALRLVRRCPEVPRNLLRPCKHKAVDFAVRLAIGVLVAAAADDAQFERAQSQGGPGQGGASEGQGEGQSEGQGDEDALCVVLRAFKLHRFHLYDGNDGNIFHHVDRTLRRGPRRAAWAAAEARTGPIYDDTGMYVDWE